MGCNGELGEQIMSGRTASRMLCRVIFAIGPAAALLIISVGCSGAKQAGARSNLVVAGTEVSQAGTGEYLSDKPVAVSQAVGEGFGDELVLVGINAPEKVKVGEAFHLEFVWQVLSKPKMDYMIAVHLDCTAPGEFFRLIGDHRPPVPTSQWEFGKYVRWAKEMTFPENATRGSDYHVEIYPYTVVPNSDPREFRAVPVSQEALGGKPSIRVDW